MKKLFIIFFSTIILSSCSQQPFKYNKSTACEINYGKEGIAIIIDGNKLLVRNTSQLSFGKLLEVRTSDRKYTTLSRYFNEKDSTDIVNSLAKSKVVYLRWISSGGFESAGDTRHAMIDVSDFEQRVDACITNQQKSHS